MEATAERTETETARPTSSNPLLEIDPGKFAALCDSRARVIEAQAKYNTSKLDTNAKKKILDAANEAFLRDFDRFNANVRGEDLPLFSQSELLDRAQSDPVVTKLVDRLLGAGHDVNAIIVAGYTQEERAQASAYLDAVEAANAAGEPPVLDTIDVPAFLLPQPLTPIEIADLVNRLAKAELKITPEQLAEFSKPRIAEVCDFLDRYAAVVKEKGDAVTVDDLPEPPEFLTLTDALNV